MPKHKRILALVKTQNWAMLPEYGEIVCEVLTMRANKQRLTAEEIAVRLAPSREAAYDDYDRRSRNSKPYAIDRGVALLALEGVLMPKADYFDQISGATSLATFQARLAAAVADESVKAIFIEVDSPGGMVLGVSEAEKAVRLAAQQKPVHAWVRGMCCSAAYWIASACTQIHAPLTTQTGSVGVYRMHVDQSGADEEWGEKYSYIFAGDRKVDGHPHGALAGKAKEHWQASVDEAYGLFTQTVMRNRGLKGQVGDSTGQGESFYGETAKKMGLVDSHKSRAEVLDMLASKETGAGGVVMLAGSGGNFNAESAETRREIKVDVGGISAAHLIALGAELGIGQRPVEATEHTDAAASIENIQGEGTRGRVTSAADGSTARTGESVSGTNEGKRMNEDLKALLYAAGVIKSTKTDDAMCWERLEGWAEAKGIKTFARDKEDEIKAYFQKLAQGKALGTTEANAAAASSGIERKELSAEQIGKAAIQRADEIRARAKVLCSSGFVVTNEAVQEAVDKSWSVEQAVEVFTRTSPADQSEKRLASVNVTESAFQAMSPLIDEALSRLMDPNKAGAQKPKIDEAAYLARKGSMAIAEKVCRAANLRVESMDDEDVAKEFLRLSAGPIGQQTSFKAEGPLPYYGPGSHPNLFAVPTQRFMMDNLQVADTTFHRWAHRMQDTNTLGFEEGIGFASYGELPAEIDGMESPGGPMTSKRLGYIECAPYSKTLGLTWQMVVKNQILQWARALAMQQLAALRTVNRALLDLLYSNPTMWDGKAMFHTDHFNLISGAGAPSITQFKKHDLAFGQQVDIDGQTELNVLPSLMLVPTDYRVEAEQFVQFMQVQNNATVDPTKLGVWKNLQVVCDAMCRGYSTTKWHTFADPNMVPCLEYQYMTGYGEGGKTTNWYDPATQTQKWMQKIVFGVAAFRFEGVTQDPGA